MRDLGFATAVVNEEWETVGRLEMRQESVCVCVCVSVCVCV